MQSASSSAVAEATYQIVMCCDHCRVTYETAPGDSSCPNCGAGAELAVTEDHGVLDAWGRTRRGRSAAWSWFPSLCGLAFLALGTVTWAGALKQLVRHSFSALPAHLQASGHPTLAWLATPVGMATAGLLSYGFAIVTLVVSKPWNGFRARSPEWAAQQEMLAPRAHRPADEQRDSPAEHVAEEPNVSPAGTEPCPGYRLVAPVMQRQ